MMKYQLILFISFVLFTFASCATEWSQADQDRFLTDCRSLAGEDETICSCGLEKAMERYTSLEEAQKAIQTMEQRELEEFLAECL